MQALSTRTSVISETWLARFTRIDIMITLNRSTILMVAFGFSAYTAQYGAKQTHRPVCLDEFELTIR